MSTISLNLNAPASTTEASPIQKTAAVGPGRIKSIMAQFPAGCQYMAKLRVELALPGNKRMPLLPSQLGGDALNYVALDDTKGASEFPVDIYLTRTTVLYAKLWNDDDTNAHSIMVIVNLED